MATGFPVKANYATGDVLTAANMNDLAGTLNQLDPTAKGDLFPASDGSTLTRLAVGTNGQVLTADSTTTTGLKWSSASSAFSGCSLTRTSNQTINNATDTAVAWDSEIYDTDSFHDNVTNNSRITIPSGKGGKYQFNFVIRWVGNSTGFRNIKLFINGVEGGSVVRSVNLSSDGLIMNGSFVLNLSAADYVQLYVYQNSGGTLNLDYIDSTQLAAGLRLTCTYLGA